jgi:hypothetical protein
MDVFAESVAMGLIVITVDAEMKCANWAMRPLGRRFRRL